MKKGFKVYKWLDENLDFNKYEMTFCGNSPIQFKNIKHIEPMPSKKLAKQLKQHDIYITASQNDPCSNSLIEALHCGLPAIALNSGGHPEIIQNAGELFNDEQEIPKLLDKISENYENYIRNIQILSIKTIAEQYLNFIKACYDDSKKYAKDYKKISFIAWLHLHYILLSYKFSNKIIELKNKL